MPDFEHLEWLESERKRMETQKSKPIEKKEVEEEEKREEEVNMKFTEPTDDDEYYD